MSNERETIENYQHLCDHVLNTALQKGVDEADVFIAVDKSLNFSIEKDHIGSVSGHKENGLGIRVIKNKKIGFAYVTNIKDKKKIEFIIEKAVKLSKLSERYENLSLPLDKPTIKYIPMTYDNKKSMA